MKRLSRSLVLVLAALAPGCSIPLPIGFPPSFGGLTERETVDAILWGGLTRTFRIYVPSANAPNTDQPRPLVIAFHGWGGNAAGMSRTTNFDELAEQHGFVVAYPEGIVGNWNDGRPLINPTIDDVGFVGALIDHLAEQFEIDPRRIYATGLSNGGHMANRLAIELSDRIAAVAPVGAVISKALSQTRVAGRPVPILLIAGNRDPITPYKGGIVGWPIVNRGEVLSAEETVAFWVNRNHADPDAKAVLLPDVDPSDGTRVQREWHAAANDGAGAEFIFLTVLGGGHTWPGGVQYLPELLIGRTSRDFSASEVIWEFFSQHSLPQ